MEARSAGWGRTAKQRLSEDLSKLTNPWWQVADCEDTTIGLPANSPGKLYTRAPNVCKAITTAQGHGGDLYPAAENRRHRLLQLACGVLYSQP